MSLQWACLILLAATMGGPGSIRAAEPVPKSDGWDCGSLALYHLLNMTGHPTDLNGLRSMLGTAGVEGHSLRELRGAAGLLGLSLDAVVLPKRRSAIQGPTLLFVKLGREGHFLVVRPVGHTGHLVQVLDGDHPPAVVDADRLFASPSWTGLALVPRHTNPLTVAGAGLTITCMIAFVSRLWTRTRSQSIPTAQTRAMDSAGV